MQVTFLTITFHFIMSKVLVLPSSIHKHTLAQPPIVCVCVCIYFAYICNIWLPLCRCRRRLLLYVNVCYCCSFVAVYCCHFDMHEKAPVSHTAVGGACCALMGVATAAKRHFWPSVCLFFKCFLFLFFFSVCVYCFFLFCLFYFWATLE